MDPATGMLIAAGIQAGTSLLGGLMGNSAAEDQRERELEDAKKARMDQLYLEMLKARHLGGGGGGGGGSNPNTLSAAQRLQAMQNQERSKVESINAMIANYVNSLGAR